mgnify:CR=1 FL=1
MGALCPVTNKQADIRVVRIGALLIFSLVSTAAYLNHWWLFWILAVDFFLRGFTDLPLSPISLVAKGVCRLVGPGQKQNAGPKIFAAKIGFTFSLVIALVACQGFFMPALVMSGMFALCAALEGFFGICVACYFYQFVCAQGEVKSK